MFVQVDYCEACEMARPCLCDRHERAMRDGDGENQPPIPDDDDDEDYDEEEDSDDD